VVRCPYSEGMKKKSFFQRVGPGFITGAADDDPSGIATYSQTGAQFGYSQLWLALFTFPLMAVIQEMCGRIGMVAGDGLAGIMRKHYGRTVLFTCVAVLLIANTINIGADLGAMAQTMQLVLGLPFGFWLISLTILTLLLEVFVSYPKYAKFLKYLTLSLFAYIAVAFIVKVDWAAVAWFTFVPSLQFDRATFMNVVAVLGTTISPYLFFWQTDQEVEEEISQHKIFGFGIGKPRVSKGELHGMRTDTVIGMFFSNLVMFFVILTAATTLASNGITNIETASQAAEALRPLAGDFAFVLFALGILGTGMLAVPVLAGSAAYAVSEAMSWHGGLSKKLKEAPGFYGIIILSTLVGLLVNYMGIPPFKMLYYTAILNGIAAPVLIVMILAISNNKRIMGKHVNGAASNIVGWLLAAVMILALVGLVIML
jgi:NRAMP (natural resistance-associated macrophage protein)-like metal ion transporter